MTADDNNPHNEAHATDPEPPQYRKVSEEELKRILAEHDKWIETEGEKGSRADLSNSDLQEANLTNANLQEAYFFEANLQQAYFTEANLQQAEFAGANLQKAFFDSANLQGALLADADLQNAELVDANLQNAIVIGANLRNAELAGANFQEADLTNANLTDVKSLLVGSLAGTDLTNAKLPEAVKEFEGLSHASETSQNARKIFLGLILGCVYSWLTLATTTDLRLLTNTASSPLPIIQTEIPIVWFYWAAPAILLCVYFYLHLYLQRLWHGLAALPAIFPDGKPLNERAYPWLLNGLVRAHFQRLIRNRPPLSHLENFVSIGLAWWLVPITLIMFWVRYLPRRDWSAASFQIFLIVAAVGFGLASYWLARRTMRRQGMIFRWRKLWSEGRTYLVAATLVLAIALSAVSHGAINGIRLAGVSDDRLAGLRRWVPDGLSLVGYSVFADLRGADLTGTNLSKANLSSADLSGAVLSRADLKASDLQNAILREADLSRANLQGANLTDVNLEDANLSFAILINANLQNANLQDANLQGAKLVGANLRDAILFRANLKEANLFDADLNEADLSEVDLQGADLRSVDLQEAILFDANLTGADLRRSNLVGADLRANLEEANLDGVNLNAANLEDANNLTQGQLDGTCGGKTTQLPEGLTIKSCPNE